MKVRQIISLLVFVLLYFCLAFQLQAQDKSNPKETFAEAESYFLFEEYAEALPLYVKLKETIPNNYNLDYKIGRCYLNLPYEREKSIDYLESAVKHISLLSKETTIKEERAPLDALFYLGDAYRINNQLEKAIQTYREFKERTTNKIFDFTLVDDEIKACQLAMIMEKRPIKVTSVNLGDIINTRFSETNPVVTPDENMIVFAAKLPFYQAMFYSKKENGKWSMPINMIPELGIDGDCFPTSISSNGSELYMYRSNEYLGDLYVTNYKDGKWTKIRKLNNNINTKYWESHACISSDGKTLYFTSNRTGGFGGLDIYKSTRFSIYTDEWGPAQNLGSVINSNYNEDTPFITSDGKRLYFSSFGHETMGGYDIFYSDLNDDGTWCKPVNIGYPINSTDDELFFNPIKDGSVAYMAKYDPKGFGRFDIFRYEIASDKLIQKYLIKGNIQLPNNISGIIYLALYDKLKKDTVLRMSAPTDNFSFQTVSGDYDLHLSSKDCKPQVVALTIPKGYNDKSLTIATMMQPLVKDVSPEPVSIVSNILKTSKPSDVRNVSVKALKSVDSNRKETKKEEEVSQQQDTSKEQAKSAIASDTLKKPSVSSTSGAGSLLKLPYIAISGILVVLLIFIFMIIKRSRKKKEIHD